MKFRPFSPKRVFITKHTRCLQAVLQTGTVISRAGKPVPVLRTLLGRKTLDVCPMLCHHAWVTLGGSLQLCVLLLALWECGAPHRGAPQSSGASLGRWGCLAAPDFVFF